MITKESLLKKYNITEDEFRDAEVSWEELEEIYKDFSEVKYDKYVAIANEFVDTYLRDLHKLDEDSKNEEQKVKVHSYRFRVKDAEHLIVKIIRKKREKYLKYQRLDTGNYEKFIMDSIGIRCFVLFKADWENFHRYLLSKFENNVEYYIKDPIRDFDKDENHYYIAESPKVHIRNGDDRKIYEKVLPESNVIDDKVYRSVHYIVKYKGVYLEIQVRTLFEEGWGEVDHAIVYPYYKDDPVLKEYTELMNRLSGLADEMGSFFYRLKGLEIEHLKYESGKAIEAEDLESDIDSYEDIPCTMKESGIADKPMNTGADCLAYVMIE